MNNRSHLSGVRLDSRGDRQVLATVAFGPRSFAANAHKRFGTVYDSHSELTRQWHTIRVSMSAKNSFLYFGSDVYVRITLSAGAYRSGQSETACTA